MNGEPEGPIIRSIRDLTSGKWVKPPSPEGPVPGPAPAATGRPDLEERLLHAERLVADYQEALVSAHEQVRALQDQVALLEDRIRTLNLEQGIRPGGEREAL